MICIGYESEIEGIHLSDQASQVMIYFSERRSIGISSMFSCSKKSLQWSVLIIFVQLSSGYSLFCYKNEQMQLQHLAEQYSEQIKQVSVLISRLL